MATSVPDGEPDDAPEGLVAPRPATVAMLSFVAVVGALFAATLARYGDPGGRWIWSLLLVVGMGAILLGVRVNVPPRRGPWWLMAAGLGSLSVGAAIDAATGTALGSAEGSLVAGPFLLAGFPLIALAGARFARAQGGRDHGPVLDAAILTIAITAVVAEAAYGIHGPTGADDHKELIQAILMAAGATWVVAMSARLLLAGGHRAVSGRAIAAASVAALAGSSILAWVGRADGVPVATLALWASGVILLGISAIHPSMQILTEETDFEEAHVRTRSVLLGAALLAPPIAILLRFLATGQTAVIATVATTLAAPIVVVRFSGLLREADHAHREAEFQMLHDPLTQLPNRRLLDERLDQALHRRHHPDRHVAVLFLDLNGFKAINDVHGHAAGDHLLAETARRITQTCRAGDTVARFAGDEFVVVLDDVTREETLTTAERINAALTAPVDLADTAVTVGASIGIALSGHLGDDPARLLSAADRAMYRAKAHPTRSIDIAGTDERTTRQPHRPSPAGFREP